jgi:GTP cyclohydrolase III
MTTTHGGKRAGAGRKPRAQGRYDSAYDFLVAVARGIEQASPEQRVAAARAVLPYEQPRRRAPKPSPRPSQLQATEAVQEASADDKAWRERADRIRKKHGRAQ